MNAFAGKLKACRLARGWSQEELAQRLGTTKQVISHYERGDRTPKVDVAARYSEVLNVPVNYLTNDMIQLRLWDHESYLEDYWNADYRGRRHLVTVRGIDPRIASDYEQVSAALRLQAEKTAAPKDDGLSPLEARLMELVRRLTDDQKQMLLAQIELLLKNQG